MTTMLYLILLTYTRPKEEIDAALDDHRAYLRRNYDAGRFLVSGPRVPASGGVILARAGSLEEAWGYVRDDPFAQRELASHEVIPFIALWSDPRLAPLLSQDEPPPDE
ncbi:MAG TPA: YciI family protein [Ktedonobacterales bacterium]